jgi:ribosomal protein S12 methylthiotransferase accessory factor
MDLLNKQYISGTHRLISPEQTLANIQPHLAAMGITRCADVTGLDRLGIPVYCSIKPGGRMVQVHQGKGLIPVTAKVSALMEAIEVFHYENPQLDLLKTDSLSCLSRSGKTVVQPEILPLYLSQNFFSTDFVIDWIEAENLLTNTQVWMPASAACICSPSLYSFSSNGLASGNHVVEATLHGFYELIERDARSRLSINGRLSLNGCQVIDLNTVKDAAVLELIEKLNIANFKLVLIWVKSCISINTFWAIILDKNPHNPSIMVNMGYGTHLSVGVAAARAITEAAQSRLTFIYGVSEELAEELPQERSNTYYKIYKVFDNLAATGNWQNLKSMAGDNLSEDYTYVLQSLASAGYQNIFRVNLTRDPFKIPVVKVFVSGLGYNPAITG